MHLPGCWGGKEYNRSRQQRAQAYKGNSPTAAAVAGHGNTRTLWLGINIYSALESIPEMSEFHQLY